MIVGAGGLSAVAGTLAVQAAAVRSGLSRIELHPETDEPTPTSTRVSRAAYFPDDGPDEGRLRAFLWAAVTEAVEPLVACMESRTISCKAWLRLPAERPPFDESFLGALQGTFLEAAKLVQPSDVAIISDATTNALAMFAAAQTFLTSNPKDGVAIVAACDSLVSDDAMDHLVDARRLATESRPWGMVPGEGAACIVLIHPENPLCSQLKPWAELSGVGVHGDGDAGPAGAHLTKAIAFAIPTSSKAVFGAVFSDINGERQRSDDWSFSAPRIAGKLAPDLEVVTPAVSQGDLGVATPLSLIALAAAHVASGWQTNDVLVACSGEGPMRGAAWLRPCKHAASGWFNRGRVKTVLATHDQAIVGELVTELTVLLERKRDAVAQQGQEGLPDWTAVASLEKRIDRFIDALAICRDLGQAAAVTAIKSGAPDGVYWGTRVLLQVHQGFAQQLLEHEALINDKQLTAFTDAVRHSPFGPMTAQVAEQLIQRKEWAKAALALVGYSADTKLKPFVLNAALKEPEALGWVLPFALSRVGNRQDAQALSPWLRSDDPTVLQASVFAWQYLAPTAAAAFVLENARNVPLLMANTADARAVSLLLADSETHKARTSFYLALGVLGDPIVLPTLLLGLEQESTVKEAAAALALITGAELWETIEHVRIAGDIELFADELQRRNDGDKDVGTTRTQEVRMCESAALWRTWLADNAALQPGLRYRLGRLLDATVAVEALAMPWVFPRLRVALANELGCVFGVRPFVEPDAPVEHQHHKLQAASLHARRATTMPPGSWGVHPAL